MDVQAEWRFGTTALGEQSVMILGTWQTLMLYADSWVVDLLCLLWAKRHLGKGVVLSGWKRCTVKEQSYLFGTVLPSPCSAKTVIIRKMLPWIALVSDWSFDSLNRSGKEVGRRILCQLYIPVTSLLTILTAGSSQGMWRCSPYFSHLPLP